MVSTFVDDNCGLANGMKEEEKEVDKNETVDESANTEHIHVADTKWIRKVVKRLFN